MHTFMVCFLTYFAVGYIFEEICLGKYMAGKEDMPNDFLIAIQTEIWLWPIMMLFSFGCIVYYVLMFLGYLIKPE